tara:strand:- start:131687 stop:133051 length:1365 start_codon:yes stop_codon:yes gene_type:complete
MGAFSTMAIQNDSSKIVIIGKTSFEGNDKTKEFILLRELTYHEGDTLELIQLKEKLIRSRDNIFNTKLFTTATFTILEGEGVLIDVVFHLEERWYVWPYPILENGDRNFNTWWQTKDFNRLTYGIYLNWFNFRGRNETFKIMMKVGFENQFSLGYDIPNLNKKKTLGLYVATGYAEYTEVNNRSEGNKRIFYKSTNGPGRQVLFAMANLTYRKNLNARHQIGLMYNQIQVDSGVVSSSTNYLKGNMQKTDFFTLSYYGKYDTRDYIEYPLKGYKIETYITKYGLGVLNNEGLNVLTTIAGLYWHKPLGGRWYVANSVVGKLSFFDDTPYSIQQGLGYANSIRGYELYVFDAEKYGIVKTNIKYNILKKKEMHLKWLKLKKFNKPYFAMYLNTYFDFAYAEDRLYKERNLLSNKWAYGYGIGLDVTAFYDFVMRVEYSINRENEKGFFLHLKKAI